MAAYYTSQAYDAPADLLWPILTDFSSWPRWFPNVVQVELEDGHASPGARVLARGEDAAEWSRWRIVEWSEPKRLVCEHLDSGSAAVGQVQAAYLQFELIDDAEGCTLEVEIGAEGYGIVGDFFVGVTLGSEVRRLLPRLVDAFTDHVLDRVSSQQ